MEVLNISHRDSPGATFLSLNLNLNLDLNLDLDLDLNLDPMPDTVRNND
jgi:hypothetical protein